MHEQQQRCQGEQRHPQAGGHQRRFPQVALDDVAQHRRHGQHHERHDRRHVEEELGPGEVRPGEVLQQPRQDHQRRGRPEHRGEIRPSRCPAWRRLREGREALPLRHPEAAHRGDAPALGGAGVAERLHDHPDPRGQGGPPDGGVAEREDVGRPGPTGEVVRHGAPHQRPLPRW